MQEKISLVYVIIPYITLFVMLFISVIGIVGMILLNKMKYLEIRKREDE